MNKTILTTSHHALTMAFAVNNARKINDLVNKAIAHEALDSHTMDDVNKLGALVELADADRPQAVASLIISRFTSMATAYALKAGLEIMDVSIWFEENGDLWASYRLPGRKTIDVGLATDGLNFETTGPDGLIMSRWVYGSHEGFLLSLD